MKRTSTRGFTMLEVLVAILVLSLGLLGLAGLQTLGLRNNTGSAQRTIATQLAYDISDRMRANYASVLAGDYNYANYGGGADGRTTYPAGVNTAACYNASTSPNNCPPATLSLQDLYDWNQQVCSQLPQSTASCAVGNGPWAVVCVDSTPNDGVPGTPACDNIAGSPYVIKIWWIEDRNNPTLVAKQWVTAFQP
jgi:type IV pilus assembly protein PilV